jgi:ABC-type multidrug transport system ATPase subunit
MALTRKALGRSARSSASLAADGTTVLVSSHLLSEVEQMCTHLGVMREGELVAQGTVAEIRGKSRPVCRVLTSQPDAAATCCAASAGGSDQLDRGRRTAYRGGCARRRSSRPWSGAGVPVAGFTVTSASLEDLFVALTGEGFDVSG